MRFESSIILFALGALASAKTSHYVPRPKHEVSRPAHFPPMSHTLVDHEVCSRAVDRILYDNVDPNEALNSTSAGSVWTDTTFEFPGAWYWDDMPLGPDDS